MATPEPCHETCPPPPTTTLPPEVAEVFLENPTRRRLIELIQQCPGMNKNQIADTLQLNASTVTHHLERLNETGHIITIAPKMTNQKFCFTPDNYHLWNHKDFRILLGRATPWKVALYLAQNPGATTKQIAQDLNRSVPTIQRHIRDLQSNRLIHSTRIDRDVHYHADQNLVEWMQRMEGWEGTM